MQTCKYCGANQLDGAIFCGECGSDLVEETTHDTTSSLGRSNGSSSSESAHDLLDSLSFTEESSINFVVVSSGRRFRIESGQEYVLGRKDSQTGTTPNVDLSEDGGYNAGVSRQHAIVSFKDGCCVIEDLESFNGTFVNGIRLEPYKPTSVCSNDELVLGTLLVQIECKQNVSS